MSSRIRQLALAAALLPILAATGCSGGRKTPPKTTVSVVNAAPAHGTLNFRREQHVEASLDFGAASSPLRFDEDEYDFNVTTTPPGATSDTLLDTFSKQVLHGTDYLFVLTEEGGTVEHLIFEKPAFTSTAQAEAVVVHAAPSQPAMDVYLTASGDISTASPIASLSFKQGSNPVDLETGDYVLTLTQAGDASHVLFTSTAMSLTGGSVEFVIADGTGDGLVPFSVIVASATSAQLFDAATRAGLEVVNAATDNAARDVYLDGDFSAPLLAAVPGPGVTPQVTVTPGDRKLSVTPAGNPGVVEIEQSYTAVAGRRTTQLLAGDPGSLALVSVQDDPRPIVGQARIRFMNAATLFPEGLAFFIVPPGTDTSGATPATSLAVPAIGGRIAVPPGTYDFAVRDSTNTLVAGPQTLTVSDEGLYTILVTNGTTGGTAQLVLLQGFD